MLSQNMLQTFYILFFLIIVETKYQKLWKKSMNDDCGPFCPLDCAPMCTEECCNVTMNELGLNSQYCEKLCPSDNDILKKMSKVQAEAFECSDYCNNIDSSCCYLLKTNRILSSHNTISNSIQKFKVNDSSNILELYIK